MSHTPTQLASFALSSTAKTKLPIIKEINNKNVKNKNFVFIIIIFVGSMVPRPNRYESVANRCGRDTWSQIDIKYLNYVNNFLFNLIIPLFKNIPKEKTRLNIAERRVSF
jgi:hypothetical protein